MAKQRSTYMLLLKGGIRRNSVGRPFYDAVKQATADDLRKAQGVLEDNRLGFWYTYRRARLEAIRLRLVAFAASEASNG